MPSANPDFIENSQNKDTSGFSGLIDSLSLETSTEALIIKACNGLKKLADLKNLFLMLKKKDNEHKEMLEYYYYVIDPVYKIPDGNGRLKIQFQDFSFLNKIYNDKQPLLINNPDEIQLLLQDMMIPLSRDGLPDASVCCLVPLLVMDKAIGHFLCFNGKTLHNEEIEGIKRICNFIAEFLAKSQYKNTFIRSENNYTQLFNEMKNGFALCRMISGQRGEPVDFSFLEMNTAFENITGLKKDKILGKTINVLIPQINPFWIKAYGEVASSNKSIRFEQYFEMADKYFEIIAFSPWNDLFATIYTDITEKKQINQQLSDVLELNQTIIKASVFGIIALNESGVCILANQAAAEIFDEPVEKLLKQNIIKFEPWIKSGLLTVTEEVLSTGNEKQLETHFITSFGKNIWLDCFFSRFKNKGKPHLLLVMNDITERKQAENLLKMSEERLKLALFAANQGLYDTNLKTGEMVVSPEYARMLGFSPETFLESYETLIERMHEDDKERVEAYYQSCIKGEVLTFHIEFRQMTRSGQWRWILSQGNIVEWDIDGSPLRLMGTHTDISDRKKMEEDLIQARIALEAANKVLENLSNTDALTGIANRRYFSEVFEKEWHRARRIAKPLSIIMMDIDFFKLYNDHYGHLKGDECLKSVAAAINSSLRRTTDIAARYGGEEFVALLPETNIEGAKIVANNIHENIEKLKIEHQKSTVNKYVSLSLGIASCIPGETEICSELLEKADKALYKAKESGRNQYRVYEAD